VQPYAQQPYGQQPMNVAMTQNGEMLPTPEPANNGSVMSGQVINGQPSYDAGYNGNQAGYQDGSANCSSPYPNTGSYVDGGYGGSAACGPDYGVSQYFDSNGGGSQWFGGVYALLMTRDNPDFRRLTIQVDNPTYPYYPTPDVTVLSMPHADHDYREGIEVRFGSTFSVGGSSCDTDCGPYGYGGYGDSSGYGGGYGHGSGYGDCGGCGCQQDYAWEVGYWILDDDINEVIVIDAIPTDTNRIYGMKNFAGLEYNRDGGGVNYRPVNHYYDYQIPVRTPGTPWDNGDADDIRVLAQRVRTNFKAQNLELNFLRLPMVCGSSCGYGSGGYDECGGGYGNCEPVACGSPFSVTALCGVRYIRIDDDVEYSTKFGDWAAGPPVTVTPAYTPFDYQSDNELFYDVNVDNHLTGFQLGANMNYCISCKCNLFWDTNFGVYNNHISSYQRVYSGGGGTVRLVNGGGDAAVESDKDDIAFVGEMRLGGSYDFTCHWRGVIAYRAVGLSGVALSVDQMDNDFANEEELALIDSDGSVVIHGVQVGAECRY
jgi:hypothetical protein